MKCPDPNCQSERIRAMNTYAKTHQLGMAQEFKLTNMTRRRKWCEACGQIFFTIEVAEQDYRKLLLVFERSLAHPKVRPGT